MGSKAATAAACSKAGLGEGLEAVSTRDWSEEKTTESEGAHLLLLPIATLDVMLVLDVSGLVIFWRIYRRLCLPTQAAT